MLIRDVCGKQSGRFNSSVSRPFLYCGPFRLQHSARSEPNFTIKSWKKKTKNLHDSHVVNAWTMAAPLAPALGVRFPSRVYSDLIRSDPTENSDYTLQDGETKLSLPCVTEALQARKLRRKSILASAFSWMTDRKKECVRQHYGNTI